MQFVDTLIQINLFERLEHRLGTHLGNEGTAFINAVVRSVGFHGLAHLRLGEELIALQRRVARIDHEIILVVDHALKMTAGHVQHQAETRRHAFKEPNMATRHS